MYKLLMKASYQLSRNLCKYLRLIGWNPARNNKNRGDLLIYQ